ncbi:MAG TPA: universal stress protein [Solirubrobacterales bacterium]|nr:universal stress protein [Solirubrobacterales bacterium]
MLGSTHRGPLGRIAPGTTMEQLLGEAPIAVAVAPPRFADRTEGESDWQPLDGDGEDTGMRVIGVGYDGSPAAPTELESRRAELHQTVVALPPEVRALPILLRRFPVPELVKAAGLRVDLLVLGTHVRGHVGRLLHKNVAGEVALEASCPVLICPTPIGVQAAA